MTADDRNGFAWAKGHGTENDFVLLPDPDGSVHGGFDTATDAALVAALCHRRRGLGADGVIRAVRSAALAELGAGEARRGALDDAEWFMDYRNADGSPSQMCGNGIRVLLCWLVDEQLVDGERAVALGTRAGTVHAVRGPGGQWSVDMGPVSVLPPSQVGVGDRVWPAIGVDTGNPHAVVLVDDVDQAGPLTEPPGHDPRVYPEGVNVEFVAPVGHQHVRMRVHERGSGETRSCGSGAVAAAVLAEQFAGGVARPATYRVDVPGGTLEVRLRENGHAVLTGPAEVVARGTLTWTGHELR